MRRAPSIAVAAVCSVALLGGCGEKSEPPTTGAVVPDTSLTTTASTTSSMTTSTTGPDSASAEQVIRGRITAFLTSDDPAACKQLLTSGLIKRAYGNLRGCQTEQRRARPARSVQVSSLRVRGRKATATAVPKGGADDGEKLKLALVNQGQGQSWRIDRLSSNAPVGP